MKLNWQSTKKILDILAPALGLFQSFGSMQTVLNSHNNFKIYSNYFIVIIFSFWFINSIKHLTTFIKENRKLKSNPSQELASE
jgi:hypothetical protein